LGNRSTRRATLRSTRFVSGATNPARSVPSIAAVVPHAAPKMSLCSAENPVASGIMPSPSTQYGTPTRMTPLTSFPKQDIRVVLFEGISQRVVEVFHDAGYRQVELLPMSLTGDELIGKVSGAHIIGIRSRTQVAAEVSGHARKLITIGCFCIGTNQVD